MKQISALEKITVVNLAFKLIKTNLDIILNRTFLASLLKHLLQCAKMHFSINPIKFDNNIEKNHSGLLLVVVLMEKSVGIGHLHRE